MAGLRRADGGGSWVLELPALEAALLRSLPDRVEEVLTHPERHKQVVDRLFPPSYADPDEEREHRALLASTMLDERRELLNDVRTDLARASGDGRGLEIPLDPAAVDRMLRFLNDLRLLLSTELGIERNLSDVDVDPRDPQAPTYSLLVWLTALEAVLVDAVSGGDAS